MHQVTATIAQAAIHAAMLQGEGYPGRLAKISRVYSKRPAKQSRWKATHSQG
jgi:hypothetical protein